MCEVITTSRSSVAVSFISGVCVDVCFIEAKCALRDTYQTGSYHRSAFVLTRCKMQLKIFTVV